MFDTVKMGVPLMLTESELNNVQWTKTNSSIDVNKKQTSPTVFKTLEDKEYASMPFIRYTYKEDDPTQCWLKVEVSIPKFVCGSNVYEINEDDLDVFYKMLRKYISVQLRVDLTRVPSITECFVEKVHVCKNFSVGSFKQDYLRGMASYIMPKYQMHQYCSVGSANVESIEWKAKRRKEKMYDKEAEIRQQKNYPEKYRHQKRAIGLLRYEIELSDTEIRQISETRRVEDILRMEVAAQILQKGLVRNGLSRGIKYTSIQQVINAINREDIPPRTKTSLIAFVTRWILLGEDECRKSYPPSSYWKNKRQIKEILGVQELLFSDTVLPPLQVTTKLKKTASVPTKQ